MNDRSDVLPIDEFQKAHLLDAMSQRARNLPVDASMQEVVEALADTAALWCHHAIMTNAVWPLKEQVRQRQERIANHMTTTGTIALAWVRSLTPERRRAIRQTAGLSQGDLARGLGCTPTAVAGWESGKRQPSGTLAERYGRLLADLEAGR